MKFAVRIGLFYLLLHFLVGVAQNGTAGDTTPMMSQTPTLSAGSIGITQEEGSGNVMENNMHLDTSSTIFYDIYTDQQKQSDPSKASTGLFFFRGEPGAPFAVINPGGGFSYVGSIHEGFPDAIALNQQGYHAFVVQYRVGSERIACEDLTAALSNIFKNAKTLDISIEN